MGVAGKTKERSPERNRTASLMDEVPGSGKKWAADVAVLVPLCLDVDGYK